MSGRVWRRLASAVLLPPALILALAGCSNDSDASPIPEPTPDPDPVVLRFLVYGDDATVAAYQQIADAYTAAHPATTFEITAVPDAATAATSAITAIDSAMLPPDVFLLDRQDLASAVEAEVLEPVDELLKKREIQFGDGFLRTALEAFSAENHLMCMPADVSPYVAYYNTDLIHADELTKDNGDPLTRPIGRAWGWTTFVQALEQAVARGATGTWFAPDLEALMPFLASGGSGVVDSTSEPTRLDLGSTASKETLKQIAFLTRTPGMTLTPTSVATTSAVEVFKQGRLGVLFGTRALVPELRAATGLNFDVAPLPAVKNVATTASIKGYCISKSSENAERAAAFIEFATAGVGAKIMAGTGFAVPSSLDAARSPEFLQLGQQPANALAFSEAGRRIVAAPSSTQWPDVVTLAGPYLARVLYDPAIDVAADATPLFDGILAQLDEDSKAVFNPPEIPALPDSQTQTPAPTAQ